MLFFFSFSCSFIGIKIECGFQRERIVLSQFPYQNCDHPCFEYRELLISGLLFSCSVVSDSLRSHGCQPARLPCLYHFLELAQTQVHWVSEAIQPLHPLLSASPASNLSQHHGPFSWVGQLLQGTTSCILSYAGECLLLSNHILKWLLVMGLSVHRKISLGTIRQEVKATAQ